MTLTLGAWLVALTFTWTGIIVHVLLRIASLEAKYDTLTCRGDAMCERLDRTTSLRYSVAARQELQAFQDTTRQQTKSELPRRRRETVRRPVPQLFKRKLGFIRLHRGVRLVPMESRRNLKQTHTSLYKIPRATKGYGVVNNPVMETITKNRKVRHANRIHQRPGIPGLRHHGD